MLPEWTGAEDRTLVILRYVMIGVGAWATWVALQPYAYGYPMGYKLFPFFAIAALCFALPGQVRFAVGALCGLTLSYMLVRSHFPMTAFLQLAMSVAGLALVVINRHIAIAAILAISARVVTLV